MNRILQLAAFTFLALLCLAQAEPPADSTIKTELDYVQVMQTDLNRNGLWPFLESAKYEGWVAPRIHSDYWVWRLPGKPEERIKLEKAKRTFGLSIAKALDDEALKLTQPTSSETREDQAKRILAAADWLRKSRGYGNLLLVTRAENLACVLIGYLVADLNYSTNSINVLLKRVSTPDEDLAFRLAVLDEEAPVPMAVHRGGNVKETNNRLELAWNRGHHDMAAWCKTNGVRRAYDKASRCQVPDVYAFFADDEASQPPYTTVNKWDQKEHQSYCVYGADTGIRQRVDTLYLFRLNVGSFPTTPPAWFGPQEKIYTATEAAFSQAWEPFEKTYGLIGQSAARTYESIRANRLMDWETSQIVEALEKAKTQPK